MVLTSKVKLVGLSTIVLFGKPGKTQASAQNIEPTLAAINFLLVIYSLDRRFSYAHAIKCTSIICSFFFEDTLNRQGCVICLLGFSTKTAIIPIKTAMRPSTTKDGTPL